MKIFGIIAFKSNNQISNNKKQNGISFGNNLQQNFDKGTKFAIDHADILLTHRCNKGCPTCIDKWVNKYKQIISFDIIKYYFNLLEQRTVAIQTPVNRESRIPVNLLGGEPTVVGEKYLNDIAEDAHKRNFLMWMSSNGIKQKTIDNVLPNFDFIHITCDKPRQVLRWLDSKYLDKIGIKFPCTPKTTLKDFLEFADATKDFPNKRAIVYNDMYRREIKLQPELAKYLSDSNVDYVIAPHGFHKFGQVNGVTIKRIVEGQNIHEDTKMIPRLYPNGNYNCTWENELNNPYLGEL